MTASPPHTTSPTSTSPQILTTRTMNSITFNQDNSCISIGTDQYQKIFNVEPFGEIYSDDIPTVFIKILFSTSLTIVILKEKDNRILKIHNLKQKLKICELIFPSTIIDVKVNKKRLLVALDIGQLYIYDLSCVKLMKIIELKKGFIGDLSNDDNSLLVIPMSLIPDNNDIFKGVNIESLIKFDTHKLTQNYDGYVLVFDTINLKPVLIMKCHSSKLKKIVISQNLIATASVKGTIIRVFHLSFNDNGDIKLFKIQNLRRGRNFSNIHFLKFNNDNSILSCGSESTIHFFKLNDIETEIAPESDDNEEEDVESSKSSDDLNENLANLLISKPVEDKSQYSFSKKIINSDYTKKLFKKLPYKEYLNNLILEPPKRSFSYIKIHERVEIGFIDDLILVVTYSGNYYQYKFRHKQCEMVNKFIVK